MSRGSGDYCSTDGFACVFPADIFCSKIFSSSTFVGQHHKSIQMVSVRLSQLFANKEAYVPNVCIF